MLNYEQKQKLHKSETYMSNKPVGKNLTQSSTGKLFTEVYGWPRHLHDVFVHGVKYFLDNTLGHRFVRWEKEKLARIGDCDPFGNTVERVSFPRSSWQIVVSRHPSTGMYAIYNWNWREGVIYAHACQATYSADQASYYFDWNIESLSRYFDPRNGLIDSNMLTWELQWGFLAGGTPAYEDECIGAQGFVAVKENDRWVPREREEEDCPF